jgi:GNAT superfamily N-acetyltransferase/acyl carrier protein
MTLVEAEHEIIAVLRRTALAGSDRPVALDQPLGEMGLGLDSLALLSFLTGLESRFGIQFDDVVWVERDKLTLGFIIDLIQANDRSPASSNRPESAPSSADQHRSASRSLLGSAYGFLRSWRRIMPTVPPDSFLRTWKRAVYTRRRLILLARNLIEPPVPEYVANIPLELSEVPGDAAALDVKWGISLASRRKLVAKGSVCLTATHDGDLAAYDWVSSPDGTYQDVTGFRTLPGACYGFHLMENPRYRGLGVGMALLSYSMTQMRRRGCQWQVTRVNARNRPMLVTASQMFGFRRVGHVDGGAILGHRYARWTISDPSVLGRVVTIVTPGRARQDAAAADAVAGALDSVS